MPEAVLQSVDSQKWKAPLVPIWHPVQRAPMFSDAEIFLAGAHRIQAHSDQSIFLFDFSERLAGDEGHSVPDKEIEADWARDPR